MLFVKRKHTGLYSNFYSNQPLSAKLLTVKAMTNRDKVLCSNIVIRNRKAVLSVSFDCGSNKSECNKGFDYITKTIQLNDFPKKVI